MMANREGSGGHSKRASSTPVKWTLVEAEPETPEGRRSKQQGYGRPRGHAGGGSSGSGGNWRSARDGGRGRGGGHNFSGGGRGSRRGGTRSNQGQGRGRGYGGGAGNYVGATYYCNQDYSSSNGSQSFEEQKAYMTHMVVTQIEFYFTVENLCRDIFLRSYMDEEGFIPIAFVANFPGVARFGVELQDITAGILASDTLQVDTENETMRMRDGWEVWLLPNQATGKQGVPRYIKVDPSTLSEEPTGGTDLEVAKAKSKQAAGRTGTSIQPNGVEAEPLAKETEPVAQQNNEGPSKKAISQADKENDEAAHVQDPLEVSVDNKCQDQQLLPRQDCTPVAMKKELTPTAPAWTPGGVVKVTVAEESTLPPGGSCGTVLVNDEAGQCNGVTEDVGGIEQSVAGLSTVPPDNDSRGDNTPHVKENIGDTGTGAAVSELSA